MALTEERDLSLNGQYLQLVSVQDDLLSWVRYVSAVCCNAEEATALFRCTKSGFGGSLEQQHGELVRMREQSSSCSCLAPFLPHLRYLHYFMHPFKCNKWERLENPATGISQSTEKKSSHSCRKKNNPGSAEIQ